METEDASGVSFKPGEAACFDGGLDRIHARALLHEIHQLGAIKIPNKHRLKIAKFAHLNSLSVSWKRSRNRDVNGPDCHASADDVWNRSILDKIETIFLVPSISYSFLSSKLVKEIYKFGGEIKEMVPEIVDKKLKEKYKT